MKILNYDAPNELVLKVLELDIPNFILEVIRKQETAFYHGNEFYSQMLCPLQSYKQGDMEEIKKSETLSEQITSISFDPCLTPTPIRKFTQASYRNIVSLLHTIPIYLRKENKNHEEGDPLGRYFPNIANPYIELYMQDIAAAADENDMHFKWIFTEVLIHELAHAALDIYNLENGTYLKEKVEYSTPFGKWHEESMANAVTLRIIREFGDTAFYAYTKDHMQKQDPEYALGVLMEDFEDLDFDGVFEAKYLGLLMGFNDYWLQYAQGNPDWEGLHQRNIELYEELNEKHKSKACSKGKVMRKLIFNKDIKLVKTIYSFATDQEFIKWAVLPYAKINANGHPQVEFTPAYYQAKKKYTILDPSSTMMVCKKIKTSIWLPKQFWAVYGTKSKEVTLTISTDSDDTFILDDIEEID